jgi:hypothetical protein
MIFVFQAFTGYGFTLGVRPVVAPAKVCVILFTAPEDSLQIASSIAQFSAPLAGCSVFGPFSSGNPDIDDATTKGMIPGFIILHADRDNKAADALTYKLQGELPFRRSYKPFPSTFTMYQNEGKMNETVMWLQFGSGVKWIGQK